MPTRSVLILGTNKEKYLNFAINCARSVQLHNPDLKIFIGTNLTFPENIPGISFFLIPESIANLFIETKLYLDYFLKTDETLYLDSDCLCYGNLEPIFEACKLMDVTVLGRTLSLEEFWGDQGAKFARETFNIDRSVLFNGGLYFLKKTDLTTKIYNTARTISEKYDEYGFNRIQNGWKNEEDLVSIGMIAYKQLPIENEELYMTGISAYKKPKSLNVLTGKIKFEQKNSSPLIEHNKQLLIHFGGENQNSYPYISQRILLKLHQKGWPISLTNLFVNIFVNSPFKVYNTVYKALKFFAKKNG